MGLFLWLIDTHHPNRIGAAGLLVKAGGGDNNVTWAEVTELSAFFDSEGEFGVVLLDAFITDGYHAPVEGQSARHRL